MANNQGGEIKEEIAQELKDNLHLNFVKRILDPKLTIEIEKGRPSTHMMASAEVDGKEIVYPTIVEREPGKLTQLSEDEAIRYALKTGEYIEFKNAEEITNAVSDTIRSVVSSREFQLA